MKFIENVEVLLKEATRSHADPKNGEYNECEKDPCFWCINAHKALKVIERYNRIKQKAKQ